MSEGHTFSDIERIAGQHYSPQNGEKWPLDEWYCSVRKTPLVQLTDGDIAKACRQCVWIEHIVPVAIDRLSRNALAGEIYDGELVVSLNNVPISYWLQHKDTAFALKAIIEHAFSDYDQDVQSDVLKLLEHLK